ncbi:MAG: class I SAM-dependent methyltransferase [Pseudomonadota bacterium]
MGFYRDTIVPRLIAVAMKTEEATRYRRELVPQACGRVLEIGIGSGLNLEHYSQRAEQVVGVEPSTALLAMARRRISLAPCPVILAQESAETLPFDDASFDTVLTTWTLCSIERPKRALEEIRRVLRPDGRLVFIEHGRAEEVSVQRWQDRVNPCWRCVAGGCNINRPIDRLIETAGFRIGALETGYLVKGPRLLTYHFKGVAAKV